MKAFLLSYRQIWNKNVCNRLHDQWMSILWTIIYPVFFSAITPPKETFWIINTRIFLVNNPRLDPGWAFFLCQIHLHTKKKMLHINFIHHHSTRTCIDSTWRSLGNSFLSQIYNALVFLLLPSTWNEPRKHVLGFWCFILPLELLHVIHLVHHVCYGSQSPIDRNFRFPERMSWTSMPYLFQHTHTNFPPQ